MIVATAPTGNIGTKLLKHLLDGDEPIRVIARDPGKLSDDVKDRVEVVTGSHSDADVVSRAFEGARAVFWLATGDPAAADANAAYVEFSRPAAAAVRDRGVRQVVLISALGEGWRGPAGHITASVAMTHLFAETGAATRPLACASLMENALRQVKLLKDKGEFYWPTPADLPTRQVASRDIAATAARLLRDPSWTGNDSVPMLGPEDISYAQMTAIMSDVLGKPIIYHDMSMDDLRAMMIGNGATPGMAGSMVEMSLAKNEGVDDMIARTPEIAANTPTTFRMWCEDVLKPAVAA